MSAITPANDRYVAAEAMSAQPLATGVSFASALHQLEQQTTSMLSMKAVQLTAQSAVPTNDGSASGAVVSHGERAYTSITNRAALKHSFMLSNAKRASNAAKMLMCSATAVPGNEAANVGLSVGSMNAANTADEAASCQHPAALDPSSANRGQGVNAGAEQHTAHALFNQSSLNNTQQVNEQFVNPLSNSLSPDAAFTSSGSDTGSVSHLDGQSTVTPGKQAALSSQPPTPAPSAAFLVAHLDGAHAALTVRAQALDEPSKRELMERLRAELSAHGITTYSLQLNGRQVMWLPEIARGSLWR